MRYFLDNETKLALAQAHVIIPEKFDIGRFLAFKIIDSNDPPVLIAKGEAAGKEIKEAIRNAERLGCKVSYVEPAEFERLSTVGVGASVGVELYAETHLLRSLVEAVLFERQRRAEATGELTRLRPRDPDNPKGKKR